jgi:glyoxylase-like metal-dependent hydrolase (beta-lactamase superfamily II)
MGEAIVAKVRSLTKKPITHVVLSHWHGDHMRGLQAIRAAFPGAQILGHPHSRERIEATQEQWLKRRVSMVPGIAKAVRSALAAGRDLSGRPLIPAEKAWLEAGLAITGELDRENRRTDYVLPGTTFEDQLTLHLGGKELQFLHLGNAHTSGDIVLWLPREKIVATGDIVTAPVPLMPSPYTADYGYVLSRIKALDFSTLIPGHGAIQHDARYVDLLADTVRSISAQMKSSVAQGLSQPDAVAKADFAAIEPRFTHGDPFLANRFRDYLAESLPAAAFAIESGKGPDEAF